MDEFGLNGSNEDDELVSRSYLIFLEERAMLKTAASETQLQAKANQSSASITNLQQTQPVQTLDRLIIKAKLYILEILEVLKTILCCRICLAVSICLLLARKIFFIYLSLSENYL